MITALSVARERELGTFEQLLVSPLSPTEIVIGKTVPAMLIGLGEGTLAIAFARLYFLVPLTGSIGLFYVAMTVYLLAVVGIGLFISSLALTQQQAILGTFAFMVPMVLLSGFASPVENMPDFLQTATLANPLRHFIVIVKGVFLKAMPAAEVLPRIVPLAILACVTLSAATWLFRWRTE
jgi:ABC-2 type transport system permease protein